MNVFLIAGEESGDKLGMALMQGLKEIAAHPPRFSGIGGARMQAQGLETLFPMSDISVMGIVEILKQYRFLKSRVILAAQAVLDQKPDVLITIDAPEFSLRVAKIVKENSDIPVIHYVAPTVWAWRPKRAAKMATHVDHVMALLPFEPPFMTAAGMSCDFVGHPVVEDAIATDAEVAEFRSKYDLGDAPYILCLPGSRRSEINRLAPVFGETLDQFAKSNPSVKIVLPTIAHVAPLVRQMTQDWAVKPIILDPTAGATPQDKRAALKGAHMALAASGTVSLELAANDTPMVIAYDMGWLSRQIIGRMLRVDTVTLANLVTETRLIPEFIGTNCRADRISKGLGEVFNNPDIQRPILRDTMDKLGKGGPNPGIRAAKSVVSYLNPA
jgi:lipid-A-disaccharide synthase